MSTNHDHPNVMPSNVCVVLLDSLHRHMLGCYGGGESETPNLGLQRWHRR